MALTDWLKGVGEQVKTGFNETVSSYGNAMKQNYDNRITPVTQPTYETDPIKREIEDLRSKAPKYGISDMMSSVRSMFGQSPQIQEEETQLVSPNPVKEDFSPVIKPQQLIKPQPTTTQQPTTPQQETMGETQLPPPPEMTPQLSNLLKNMKSTKTLNQAQLNDFLTATKLPTEFTMQKLTELGYKLPDSTGGYKGFDITPQIPTMPTWFESEADDSGLTSFFKGLGNVVPSAVNIVGQTANAIINPIDTVEGLYKIVTDPELAKQAGGEMLKPYTSLEGFKETLVEDPLRIVGDIASLLGGAGALSKTSTVGKIAKSAGISQDVLQGIQKIGDAANKVNPYVKLPEYTAKGVMQAPGKIAKSLESTTTYGLNALSQTTPEVRTFAMKNPKLLTEKQNIINREGGIDVALEGISDKVRKAADDIKNNKTEIGKAYEVVKQNPTRFGADEIVNNFNKQLESNNIRITEKGDLDFSSSNIGGKTDQNAIKEVYNLIKIQQGKELNGKLGLNLRQNIQDKINWTAETTDKGNQFVKQTRRLVDDVLGKNIKGLKELDAQYGPKVEELNKLKASFFDREGNIKPGAYNTLLKITDIKNKPKLELLESLIPGIGKEMDAIKYAKMIKEAGERQTGASLRGILGAGGGMVLGGGFTPTGIMSGIAGYFLSDPNTTINLFKKIGGLRGLENKVLKGVRLGSDDVKKIDDAIRKVEQGTVEAKLKQDLDKFRSNLNKFIEQKALPEGIPTVIPEGGLPQVKLPMTPTKRPVRDIVELPKKQEIPRFEKPTPGKPLQENLTKNLKTIKTPTSVRPTQSKELQPLYDEAKKYKSADEFVKQMVEGKTNNISDLSFKARLKDSSLKEIEKKVKVLEERKDNIKSQFNTLKKKEGRELPKDASKEGIELDKQYKDLEGKIDDLNDKFKERKDKIAEMYVPSYEGDKMKSHLKQIREEANKGSNIKTLKKVETQIPKQEVKSKIQLKEGFAIKGKNGKLMKVSSDAKIDILYLDDNIVQLRITNHGIKSKSGKAINIDIKTDNIDKYMNLTKQQAIDIYKQSTKMKEK